MEKKLTSKDLMVGDWVLNTYHNKPMRVKEICADKIILEGQDRYKMEGFEPIPITPEILEKNGFVTGSKGVYYVIKLGDNQLLEYYGFEHRLTQYWITVDDWENHERVAEIADRCHIRYIHELQHALRLFDIEKEIAL